MTTMFYVVAFLATCITGVASVSKEDNQKLVKFAEYYKTHSLTLRGLAFPGFRPYAYLNVLSHQEIGSNREVRMKVRVRYQTNELVAADEPLDDPDKFSFDFSGPDEEDEDPNAAAKQAEAAANAAAKEAAAAAAATAQAAKVKAAMATYPEGLKDGNLVLYLEAELDVKGGLAAWEVSRMDQSPAKFTYATGDEEPKAVPKEANKEKLNKLKEHTIKVLPEKFQAMLRKAQSSATWTRPLSATAEEQTAFLGDETRRLLTTLVNAGNSEIDYRMFHVSEAMKAHGFNEHGSFEDWSISPKNKLEFTVMYFTNGGVGKRDRYPPAARKAHTVLLIHCAAAVEGSTSTNFRVLLDQSKISVEVAEAGNSANARETTLRSLQKKTPLTKPDNLESKAGREYQNLMADTIPEVANDMKKKLRAYLKKIWKL